MTDKNVGRYRVKKGFRDLDGTYYKTGRDIGPLFQDSHVRELERNGKIEQISHSTYSKNGGGGDYRMECGPGEHWVKGHEQRRRGREERVHVEGHCAKNPRRYR